MRHRMLHWLTLATSGRYRRYVLLAARRRDLEAERARRERERQTAALWDEYIHAESYTVARRLLGALRSERP